MTELRYIDWKRFVRTLATKEAVSTLLKGRSLQWYLSLGLRDQKIMTVSLDKVDELILEYKGCRFYADSPNFFHIFSVYKDYPLGMLDREDTVLDLGANIGAFSIPAAKIAKKVYAVEPIFSDGLGKNIKLNSLSNIEVWTKGIGLPGSKKLDFMGTSKICQLTTLSALRSLIGRIDYLKIDIEGYEEYINACEFEGIKVITGEFHLLSKETKDLWKTWLDWFTERDYQLSLQGSSYKGEVNFTAWKI